MSFNVNDFYFNNRVLTVGSWQSAKTIYAHKTFSSASVKTNGNYRPNCGPLINMCSFHNKAICRKALVTDCCFDPHPRLHCCFQHFGRSYSGGSYSCSCHRQVNTANRQSEEPFHHGVEQKYKLWCWGENLSTQSNEASSAKVNLLWMSILTLIMSK